MDDASMNEYKKIGQRIREIRQQKKMSQADLSEKAHISLSHVSEIENGKSTLLLTTFMRIVEALQTSADAILRVDIPEVKNLYQNELSEILKDCTPSEIDSLLKILNELKTQMHSVKPTYEQY
ncbi:MAG: helix-turn-helix transcriptional regulator [Eubacteriales bacterium]|nr:helix-turn-helix transcriptional regulator [Eubacteriales bacterium]